MGLEVTLKIVNQQGEAEVRERGALTGDFWDSITLLNEDVEDVCLSIYKDSDTPKGSVCFELSGYHMENRKNNRAFHVDFRILLKRRDLEQMRAYLDFLLVTDIEGGGMK